MLFRSSDALIKYETIDENQIADIMAGREARQPAGWEESSSPPAPPAAGASTPAPDVNNPAGQH